MQGYTSETSPIQVAFLAGEASALSGRIGVTFAPGKKDDRWERDLDLDLSRLRGEYRVDVLVPLIEDKELRDLKIPGLVDRAIAHGLETVRFPIIDVSVPASMEALVEVTARLLTFARAGRTVVIHCRGGLGRAGLVAACCLVGLGSTPVRAIAEVRRVRPGAIQTRPQELCVTEFASAWGARVIPG